MRKSIKYKKQSQLRIPKKGDKNMQEKKSEANVDIKGTLVKFIKTDEPELSQEEAIMKYGESKKTGSNNNNSSSSNDDDSQNAETTEEQEHLKRVKQELLASLERVKQLEKKIYGKEEKISSKKDLKISNGGKQVTKEIQENNNIKEKEENQQEREQTENQHKREGDSQRQSK